MSLKCVECLTTYLDLESLKIQRPGFYFKSNLTSAIGDLVNCDIKQALFPAIMPWPMTATVVMAAADEEPMEGCRGVLPPKICGGNRSSIISSMFFIKNT
jgi:hypothetical protein